MRRISWRRRRRAAADEGHEEEGEEEKARSPKDASVHAPSEL